MLTTRIADWGLKAQQWLRRTRGRAGEALLRYNDSPMARGWESKGVEEHRETQAEPSARRTRPERSAEEQERSRKREELQLARKRMLADLASARHPRHRELLERTVADLEERIRALGGVI